MDKSPDELNDKLKMLLKLAPKNSKVKYKMMVQMSNTLIQVISDKNPPENTTVMVDEILYEFMVENIIGHVKNKDKKTDLSSFEKAFEGKQVPELKDNGICNPHVTHKCTCGNHTAVIGFRNPTNGRAYVIMGNSDLNVGSVTLVFP